MKKIRYILLALAVLSAFTVFGGNYAADSVKVSFRVGYSRIDLSFGNNRAVIDDFIAKIARANAENAIDSIVVRAYASPDGTLRANELLSRRRCEEVADYIASHAGINRAIMVLEPGGIDWSGLRRLVAEDMNVPSREKILEILDNTPVWIFDSKGRIVSGRKKQLMDLAGGRPYRWMLANLFPELRNSVAVVMVYKTDAVHSDEKSVSVDNAPAVNEVAQEVPEPESDAEVAAEEPVLSDIMDDSRPCLGPFALKTNLLYYAALLPNIEVEWLFKRRWSVNLEGDVAWYARESHMQSYRLAVVSSELRYWALSPAPWQGMYVGALAGWGIYDLENKKTGYQGSGVMAGVSVGYMWRIGRRLSFDAGAGVGYMYTRYKEYIPRDGHFLYQRTRNLNYFGPLSLGLSLTWHFGNNCVTNKTLSEI